MQSSGDSGSRARIQFSGARAASVVRPPPHNEGGGVAGILGSGDDLLVERVMGRGSERSGDNAHSIRLRLKVFHEISYPAVQYFGDIAHTIASSRPMDAAWADIKAIIDRLLPAPKETQTHWISRRNYRNYSNARLVTVSRFADLIQFFSGSIRDFTA
jgi:hypothetical protein